MSDEVEFEEHGEEFEEPVFLMSAKASICAPAFGGGEWYGRHYEVEVSAATLPEAIARAEAGEYDELIIDRAIAEFGVGSCVPIVRLSRRSVTEDGAGPIRRGLRGAYDALFGS